MGSYKGECPKCGSTNLTKEYIMSAQTGDLICIDCKYTDCRSEFNKKDTKKSKQ